MSFVILPTAVKFDTFFFFVNDVNKRALFSVDLVFFSLVAFVFTTYVKTRGKN